VKGATAIAVKNAHLEKQLLKTHAAYFKRPQAKRSNRKSIPSIGLITLTQARHMKQTKAEKAAKKEAKKREKEKERIEKALVG
jgi:hypothetical protein